MGVLRCATMVEWAIDCQVLYFWVFLLGWFRVSRFVFRVFGQGFEAFT
jgi:hypothetical protein